MPLTVDHLVLTSVALNLPFADGSFAQFFDSVGKFVNNISEIQVWPLLAALACQGIFLTLRTRAWFNGLRAAYPGQVFPWRNIWAAEIAGNGISSVIPAHAGAIVRLYLGKNTVQGSSYATVGSSFMVALPFDLFMGTLILIYGFTQGVFPRLPDLSKLNAFDLSFFAQHPKFAVFFVTAVPILVLAIFAWASVRVRDFWAHVRQGVALLRSRELYVRGALVPQLVAWIFRLTCVWMTLLAFNLPASMDLVLTVIAVQVAASMIPLTPQGAGVQQALLYSALAGVIAGPLIAAYSVGQQIALAAFNALFGLVALAVVFRTTDWRGLMAAGRAEKAAEESGADGSVHGDFDRYDDFAEAPTGEFPRYGAGQSGTTLEYPIDPPHEPRHY